MDIPKAPVPVQEPTPIVPRAEQDEGVCPTCGYFAGAMETCVRCGSRVHKKISVRLIRRISIYGSIVGLVLLWIAAYAKNPQIVHVSDIDELMNGALVKIVGTVSQSIIDEERNALKLKIDDGTGEISANAFNKLNQFKKVLGNNMPGVGDKIELVGTLNVSQKFGATMFLSVPDRVKILDKFELKLKSIGDITLDDVGKIFLIHAWISEYKPMTTKRGSTLHRYTLTDKSGSIETVVFEGMMEKMTPKQQNFFKNWGKYKLEFMVKIDEYRKKLQATITDTSKIRGISRLSKDMQSEIKTHVAETPAESVAETPQKLSFSKLGNNDIGKLIEVDANIRFVSQKSKGTSLTLDDGTGSLKVMVWESDQAGIKGFEYVGNGDRITGVFKLDEYKGSLQLKIVDPHQVKLIQK